ncbi:thiamine-phosphate kinase [Cellulomonas sp. PSBB021]|uniref:thiamine-phosphate kinase n=1 Tax=Cellulomonas sp. PSBB021 TaxID=2003551 RepID=UPI000B8D892B|nr:thiamine-phosphate kinase [Cellulomonas sp. PSBB021]ASR54995.1 thiamine-phosphate kinase [Cellulomonas sp. PSBB021]
MRVADLTEEQLLARIVPELPAGAATLLGPGDDAAVVAAADGRFVVTTDVLVEDRHFRRPWSSGEDVGRRAAVQNLADVAAMGAVPTSLVVTLVVPAELDVDWVVGLARGLAAECGPLGAGVVGGDLSGGPLVVVGVAAHGDLQGRAPVLRSGARTGDVVAHAGVLGWSAAGLASLSARAAHVPARFVEAYLRPRSPLAAGPDAARAGATAMMDVSDGLLKDAGRLARASGVRVDLDRGALAPAADALADVARGLDADPWAWVLGGGEDHGLLATFPAGTELPAPFRVIGRVIGRVVDGAVGGVVGRGEPAGDDEPAVTLDGEAPGVATGWDHFAGRTG